MKVGLSSYSLINALNSGEMSILDAIQWVADNGGEHIELVPLGFTIVDNLELANAIKEKALSVGIEISGYSFSANFCLDTEEAFQSEVDRVKQHVDIAHRLGINSIRHDVSPFDKESGGKSVQFFEKYFSRIVEGSQVIADYAAQYGITSTIENHGYIVQASDRLQMVIDKVNRPNFKLTLDIGNFLCVDEEPLVAVMKSIKYANRVHFKDFYIRPYYENPGGGAWLQTANDNFLRGAILGHGDIHIRQVIKLVKESGYDGYLTVEFEGMEDGQTGSKIGMANLKRLWNEV